MRLIVPHTGELQPSDARLIRLAEFLGVDCDRLRLAKGIQQGSQYIEKAVPDQNSCLVINPQVMREWVGSDSLSPEIVSSLAVRFSHIFVHALKADPFVAQLVATLSGGGLRSVLPIMDSGRPYEISSDSEDICGPFSGLSFISINTANDHVLVPGPENLAVRKLISIGGLPNMAAVKRGKTEMLFVASEDTADIDVEIDREPIGSYFSRLMPHAMALRHIFGEECWCPRKPHASIIVDDPLLRQRYGYLNFETLLRLTEEHDFHTTISFIPQNYKRNSARTIRLFRENPHRLSICFHGNDHTEAEFASTDFVHLNRMLCIAEERMRVHAQVTGLYCDRVMVFPQDNYSMEALDVLKARNFHAAVSSPYCAAKSGRLTIADLAQPAVLRYRGFPLFIRDFIRSTQSQDIAFNLFFGKPILIGEHHETFKRPGSLLDLVQQINSMAPGISWSNLQDVVDSSTLKRRSSDGIFHIRAYSPNVCVCNDLNLPARYSIEWAKSDRCPPVEQVLRGGRPLPGVEVDETGIRVWADLPPGVSQTFSVMYRNDSTFVARPCFMWEAKAFLRRRLSELRDNYLSKNQHVLTAAETFQRRFLK